MNIQLSITLGIVLALHQYPVLAGSVTDTFSTGDTLTADKLNNIKDAVNDNDIRITGLRTLNVYVNSVRRGALIDSMDDFSPAHFSAATVFTVLLDSGYIAFLSTSGDGLHEYSLAYESVDCTGQAYDDAGGANPVLLSQGYVYSNDSPSTGTAYYVPAGAAQKTVNIQSYTKDDICNSASTTWSGVPVYLNEPSITGVSNADLMGDLKVGL
jgi:hypothetical protein